MTEDQLVEHEKSDKIEMSGTDLFQLLALVVYLITYPSYRCDLHRVNKLPMVLMPCDVFELVGGGTFPSFSCFAENLQRNLMQKCWQMKLN